MTLTELRAYLDWLERWADEQGPNIPTRTHLTVVTGPLLDHPAVQELVSGDQQQQPALRLVEDARPVSSPGARKT